MDLLNHLDPNRATAGRAYLDSLLDRQETQGNLLKGMAIAAGVVAIGLAVISGRDDDEDDDDTRRRRNVQRYLDA